jgi:hypothetical protein
MWRVIKLIMIVITIAVRSRIAHCFDIRFNLVVIKRWNALLSVKHQQDLVDDIELYIKTIGFELFATVCQSVACCTNNSQPAAGRFVN